MGATRSDLDRRARSDAWLVFALALLVFVPMPALISHLQAGLAQRQLAEALGLIGALVHATPLFALPPFILGGGIGGMLYLVMSAPERLQIMERGGVAAFDARALVASSLIGATFFASYGLVLALTVFRVAG
jgi:hypothetical protein